MVNNLLTYLDLRGISASGVEGGNTEEQTLVGVHADGVDELADLEIGKGF